MQCPKCGGDRLKETMKERDAITVADHTFIGRVAALKCASCGEVLYHGPALEAFELAIAYRLAESGTSSGAAFKFMRKAIGLRAVDLAKLLQVAGETISRWETEQRDVDRGALAVLGALVMDRLEGRTATLDRLRAIAKPRKLPKVVQVKVEELR